MIQKIENRIDERGYFAELVREDWKSLLLGDQIVQFSLAYSRPGVIRAWHRHARGQNDYVVCISGSIKECIYDDRRGSATRGELDEIMLDSRKRFQIVRVVGECWHGYKVEGDEPAVVLYGVTRLYNHRRPDEERRPRDDKEIIPTSINGNKSDYRVGKPYDWEGEG